MRLTVTNYLDVISSWCFWATPAWLELQARYGDEVDFRWKIALMDQAGLPPTKKHLEWYYRRSGMLMRSPVTLKTEWMEEGAKEYLAPNCTAEAARDLGIEDDRVWIALSRAELLEDKRIARWEISADLAAQAAGLDAKEVMARAQTPEIEARVRQSTTEFHAMQVTQRPTFVVDSTIGDRAVFSGFAKAAPVAATIEAMLDDLTDYRAYAAQVGEPPP